MPEIIDTSLLLRSFSGMTLLLLSHVEMFDLELLSFLYIKTKPEASELRLTCASSVIRRLLIQGQSHSSHFE